MEEAPGVDVRRTSDFWKLPLAGTLGRDNSLRGFAQQFAQALNSPRERRMSRKQIIEEPVTIVAGAFQWIHDEKVGEAARGVGQR